MPLGLITSEQISGYWAQNTRRSVFYSYPQGAAPLTGLLSLTDSEETPQPEYGWNEERWSMISTQLNVLAATSVPFHLTGTNTTAGANVTPTAGTTYRVYVDSVTEFQTDDMVKIMALPTASGSTVVEAAFRVVSKTVVTSGSVEFLELIATETTVEIVNATSNNCKGVYMGTSYAEGARSRSGRSTYPSEIGNYTQIFKTPFEVTGTSIKAGLKYDKSGVYKDQLKKNGINHMAGIEWSLFFGARYKTTATDPDTGTTTRRSGLGGLLWFLQQWEKGSVANGGAFAYRANATDVSTQTDYRTYTDKRIIRLGGISVSKSDFNAIEGLAFRKVNSTEWCKLCLCGSSYFGKVNETFERQVQVTQMRGETYKGWDFEMTQRSGPNGTTGVTSCCSSCVSISGLSSTVSFSSSILFFCSLFPLLIKD